MINNILESSETISSNKCDISAKLLSVDCYLFLTDTHKARARVGQGNRIRHIMLWNGKLPYGKHIDYYATYFRGVGSGSRSSFTTRT